MGKRKFLRNVLGIIIENLYFSHITLARNNFRKIFENRS